MPVLQGEEGAKLFLDLLDKPVAVGARLALARALLELGATDGLRIAVERHGVVASFAILRDEEWVYSLLPAQQWVLAYIRPPEIRKGKITLEILRTVFPDASMPQPDHLTVRLRNNDDAEAFCKILQAHA